MKSKALLISLILGGLYGIYIISYFFNGLSSASSGAEAAGAVVATALVAPHMILVVLAVIFNALAYFKNAKGFALTGGILYSVAGGIFILYLPFVIVSIITSFIGYSKLKKLTR